MSSENDTIWHYDVFSAQAGKGNPAGILPNAETMSETDMQRTACALGFNETVFIGESSVADYRFRFFTPGHEINLCGHGTIAGVFHLNSVAALKGKDAIRIETKAGVIECRVHDYNGSCYISMDQAAPEFVPFTGNVERLASSIGIESSDIDNALPSMYGSTGTWTLLVPIMNLEAFSKMKPQMNCSHRYLRKIPAARYTPFACQPMLRTATFTLGIFHRHIRER